MSGGVDSDMSNENCDLCNHSLADNQHGFDQNDAWMEEDTGSETGYKLVHSGSCTYCRICNPRLFARFEK